MTLLVHSIVFLRLACIVFVQSVYLRSSILIDIKHNWSQTVEIVRIGGINYMSMIKA